MILIICVSVDILLYVLSSIVYSQNNYRFPVLKF